jgi:hypothetical protein
MATGIDDQESVLTHAQLLACGYTDDQVQSRVRRGEWQRLHRAVYATFSGPVPRLAHLWAAVLACGPDAELSHGSAAELWGCLEKSQSRIHVTIPHWRRAAQAKGLVVHRSARIDRARHPALRPPRTKIEDTLLDLAADSGSADKAIGWLSLGCGGGGYGSKIWFTDTITSFLKVIANSGPM